MLRYHIDSLLSLFFGVKKEFRATEGQHMQVMRRAYFDYLNIFDFLYEHYCIYISYRIP